MLHVGKEPFPDILVDGKAEGEVGDSSRLQSLNLDNHSRGVLVVGHKNRQPTSRLKKL